MVKRGVLMDKNTEFILWFDQVGIEDVGIVGGKNASLGEMYKNLAPKGVKIPNGFCVTAHAYKYFVEKTGTEEKIRKILGTLDTSDVKNLAEHGQKVRQAIMEAELPQELKDKIVEAYINLCKQYGDNTDVAVRSSATAEDLPDASFAGQQETYLNIKGAQALLESCKKCFASLFTNRAIYYRQEKGFDHFKVLLSIGVQKMVRSDLASSGVMFSIDTESGFPNAVLINSAYGLGENVVQGAVNPDEFYVFKPTLREGYRPIIQKSLGSKEIKMVYSMEGTKPTKNVHVEVKDRKRFSLTDDEILTLAKWAVIVEDHYSEKAGHFKPMDMEWAKDGEMNELFIVQARPETVQSQKDRNVLEQYVIKEKGEILTKGKSVGDKIGQGEANIIKDVKEIHKFKKGQVLVTEMTDPDWVPIMKIASAIVTNRGGRTCFTGDTKILTSEGFKTFKEVFNDYEGILVPSLNRETLKIEWNPIVATMKRKAKAIEISTSQTGRMKNNHLRLTPDHKMLTYERGELISKEIQDLLSDDQMLLLAQKIPSLSESSEKEQKLAYLLGAVSTDGHIYLSRTHGEVQFIQKPTEEKQQFIEAVQESLEKAYGKRFSVSTKKVSDGFIRGKQAKGQANAYRCYSKSIAEQLLKEKQGLVHTLLVSDEKLIFNFLAGVIDGDGYFNQNSGRVNIYISNEQLLQAVMVGCLRLGIVPQVSSNRSIHNVQIVEKIAEIFRFTKRVKGKVSRTKFGTRFFAAGQVLKDINKINCKGRIKPYFDKNLLIDSEKIGKNILPICTESQKSNIRKILDSDTRMQRCSFEKDLGLVDVYNITVEGNHNYLVFTDRYTPVIANNCHAAIVSRELGIPCIVGTGNATEAVEQGKKVTVDCSQGEEGYVYEGISKFDIEKTDLSKMGRPKTKVMINVGNPDEAFSQSFLPNEGVGLAREEFIVTSYIQAHPLALLHFDKIEDEEAKQKIQKLTEGYGSREEFFVDKLAQGVGMIAAAFHPKDVILRFSDFKTNEYANLIGGPQFEPEEGNPMIGWRGASRYYSKNYREGFALECRAIKKVRDEMGLKNLKVMIPMCRTLEEGKKVLAEMEKNGLKKGENDLQVYVMCEVPANVILAEQFADLFDGFSIGSNDLTQFTLAVDRDSELVAHIFDERNDAVKSLVAEVIKKAKEKGRKIGICGDAPSTYPEFAEFLVEQEIDSISLSPDAVLKTAQKIYEKEQELGR